MKKQILKITENELHSIIKESVRHIIKETLSSNGEYDVLKDIMNGEVMKDRYGYACSIVPYEENSYGCIEVQGVSGNEYNITVYGSGCLKKRGADARWLCSIEDYRPDEPHEFEHFIDKVIIEKINNSGFDNEIIPYEKNEEFEDWLYKLIDWDWNNYDFDLYDEDERPYYDDDDD